MQWRRYGYATRSRGLNGMDIRAIKKQTTNESQARKFGTELTSNVNINNNQKNTKNKKKVTINARNNRKRTFHQLNEEHKQEESNNNNNNEQYFGVTEQPTKRFRYNLRSRSERTLSTEVLGIINKENKENKPKNKEKNKKKMEMDISDSDSEDEDIDLIQYKNKKNKNKHNNKKKQFPVRRSLRLKNKRLKKLELENKNKKLELKKAQKPRPKLKYILDETAAYLECDLENTENDIYAIEYVRDIIEWYYECENSNFNKTLIKNDYICTSFQTDLNESMRFILLNWLLNVHRRFKLLDRTLFLGIYIFDAYLSLVPIKREQLQLIGCASIWIASKYTEIYAPEANDFAYISDYSFNIQTLFEAEIQILCKLKFKFANIITPLHFVERYLQIAMYPIHKKYKQRGTVKAMNDSKTYIDLLKHLTYFFIELSLFDCKLISTQKPSIIAAASLCFAMLSISLYAQWPEFLKQETGYLYKNLKPILKRLNQLKIASDQNKISGVKKKHTSIKKWLDKLNIDAVINNKDQN